MAPYCGTAADEPWPQRIRVVFAGRGNAAHDAVGSTADDTSRHRGKKANAVVFRSSAGSRPMSETPSLDWSQAPYLLLPALECFLLPRVLVSFVFPLRPRRR